MFVKYGTCKTQYIKYVSFENIIKQLRKSRKVTQSKLAEILEIKRENRQRISDPAKRRPISRLFGLLNQQTARIRRRISLPRISPGQTRHDTQNRVHRIPQRQQIN